MHEAGFEALGRRGIGLISYSDEKRRKNLLQTALYLVKTDLFVRIVVLQSLRHGHCSFGL